MFFQGWKSVYRTRGSLYVPSKPIIYNIIAHKVLKGLGTEHEYTVGTTPTSV